MSGEPQGPAGPTPQDGSEQVEQVQATVTVEDEHGIPVVSQVVKKTTRFSKEFVATMISLASAAFGVVAALAWNSAITEVFNKYITTRGGRVTALFIYAVIVTLIGVTVIVFLGRLAGRLNAAPVEFKYPGVPKS
jgi:uncharacterized membrane protein YjjP (DUF1212 family)